MAPRFRQNDYQGGIQAAITAMVGAIGGEYVAERGPARRDRHGGSLWSILIILAIIILISRMGGGRGNNYRRRGWSSGTGWYGGGFSGGGRGFGGGFGGGFSGG